MIFSRGCARLSLVLAGREISGLKKKHSVSTASYLLAGKFQDNYTNYCTI